MLPRKLKYGSVCSGIEAASVAWKDLGWEAQWYSEIEPFPSAVLAHRFPTVPNLGDMTLIQNTETFNATTIDLLVGGTPCQSFSVAGLRKGLDDPRGNLMLTFLGLADKKKPRWIVWENVPGVLSSNGGKDFGTFLGALGELGYGIAYRVLDAQYFGVAQRRRRVFVVGYLGDWRVAAAVLFEQHSLQGNSKASREKRKATSADAEESSGGSGFRMTAFGEYADDDTASTLKQRDYKDATDLVAHAFKVRGGSDGGGKGYLGQDETAFTISTTQDQQIAQPIAVDCYNFTTNDKTTQTIRSQNDKEHIGAVLEPIAVDVYNQTINRHTFATVTAAVGGPTHSGPKVLQPTIIDRAAFNQGENAQYEPRIESGEIMSSLVAKGPHAVQHVMAIRRLTPTECERLQGFPDGHTKIPYRNKEAEQCPDGPRYKACGNSMAVPVMAWIGKRIQQIENENN
jgi:DNA (cytosine-5)-methyltransferase 1